MFVFEIFFIHLIFETKLKVELCTSPLITKYVLRISTEYFPLLHPDTLNAGSIPQAGYLFIHLNVGETNKTKKNKNSDLSVKLILARRETMCKKAKKADYFK